MIKDILIQRKWLASIAKKVSAYIPSSRARIRKAIARLEYEKAESHATKHEILKPSKLNSSVVSFEKEDQELFHYFRAQQCIRLWSAFIQVKYISSRK